MAGEVATRDGAVDTQEPEFVPTVYSPISIEQAIQRCSNRIANGVMVCAKRFDEWKARENDFDVAWAKAFLSAEGSVDARKQKAVIETEPQRTARDIAEGAYKYADRQARALENELKALQSVGASIRAAYQVAGRGEGA